MVLRPRVRGASTGDCGTRSLGSYRARDSAVGGKSHSPGCPRSTRFSVLSHSPYKRGKQRAARYTGGYIYIHTHATRVSGTLGPGCSHDPGNRGPEVAGTREPGLDPGSPGPGSSLDPGTRIRPGCPGPWDQGAPTTPGNRGPEVAGTRVCPGPGLGTHRLASGGGPEPRKRP